MYFLSFLFSTQSIYINRLDPQNKLFPPTGRGGAPSPPIAILSSLLELHWQLCKANACSSQRDTDHQIVTSETANTLPVGVTAYQKIGKNHQENLAIQHTTGILIIVFYISCLSPLYAGKGKSYCVTLYIYNGMRHSFHLCLMN